MTVKALFDAGYFSDLAYQFSAGLSRIVPDTKEEVRLAAALCLQQTQLGHVCVVLSKWAGKPVRSLEGKSFPGYRWPPLKTWQGLLKESPLVTAKGTGKPLVLVDDEKLYLHRFFHYQEQLATWIRARAFETLPVDEGVMRTGIERLFKDSDGDGIAERAARSALQRRFVVITGGPGTGKTTIVMRVLALLAEQWRIQKGRLPEITALAPTGKAAMRLGEVMGKMADDVAPDDAVKDALPRTAETIHRLLGRFRSFGDTAGFEKERREIPSDVVVLDEASMVDIELMYTLMETLRPSTRLILLGDKDQLSSVAAGSVLADICDAAEMENSPIEGLITRLLKSHRFDDNSGIGQLARAINQGDADKTIALLKGDPSRQVTFVSAAEREPVRRALHPLVVRYYGEALAAKTPEEAMARFAKFRILNAHRAGDTGQTGVNRFAEGALAKRGVLSLSSAWYEGRPVMVTRNDYHLGLFNGDIGLTLRHQGQLGVFFTDSNGEMRRVMPPRLQSVETAFAMTVHRSQGSEFDHVAVVLPERPSPITVRELLYTACTRARRHLTIIGTEAAIRHAVNTPTERASGLAQRLLDTGSLSSAW